MNIKRFISDETAVSPVIGVILMVAITVILAAVIGTFVLGLGENVQTTPQAKFTFDQSSGTVDVDVDGAAPAETVTDDSLTITHDGGDSLQSSELTVNIQGARGHYDDDGSEEDLVLVDSPTSDAAFSNEVTAGTSVLLDKGDFAGAADGTDPAESLNLSASTVRVTWSDTDTDKSATLGRWDGPDA